MKKLLKILLIIVLSSSLIAVISFFAFDYSKVKQDFKNKKTDFFNFSKEKNEDFEDYIIDKSNEFADNLTDKMIAYSFGNSIANFVTKSVVDGISTSNLGLLPEKIIDKHKHLIHTQNLDDFDVLKLNVLSSAVQIQQGNQNKIEFYSDKKDTDINKYIEVSQKKSKYTIEQKSDRRAIYMRITLVAPEKTKVYLNSDNSMFLSDSNLKSLSFDGDNAIITLKGDTSYDINIETSNSHIEMDLKDYDAEINLSMSTGVVEILGEEEIFSEYKEIYKKIKNAKHSIKIETSNSFVEIK